MKTILETDRLLLRYLLASDIDFLVSMWTNPKITAHVGGPRDKVSLTNALQKAAADPYADEYDLWPVAEKETGMLVGFCGILDKEIDGRTEYEVNYFFDEPAWGKGYATEIAAALVDYAFNKKGLKRVVALIAPKNEASGHVAEKVGMAMEKEVVRPDGKTKLLYALDKAE